MITFLAFLSVYCKFFERNHAFSFICVKPSCQRPCYFSSITWFKEEADKEADGWEIDVQSLSSFPNIQAVTPICYWKTRKESLCSCSGQTNYMLAKKRLQEPMMKGKGSCWIFAEVLAAENADPWEMSEFWRMAVESPIQGRTWSLSVVCLQVCDMPFSTRTWEGK